MSLSGIFSSIADKAQNAINQTPLAGHIHTSTPAGGPNSTNPAASQSSGRSLALGSLQYQIRNLGQQYSSATPLQRIITLEKGVALDFDGVARDNKAQSKELYTWGQHEELDLTDVTDRLAYLNYVQGALSASLSTQLDSARAPLKQLRDAEAAILPKRNIRAGLRNQIARIEHNPEKGSGAERERRVAELKEQLSRAESHDEQAEKELELLKRKAIRESEQAKWEAILEYGEKLVLLAQAAKPIIGALPTLPPTTTNTYAGARITAAARASLQQALDSYKPGQTTLDLQVGADLSRSDTRSFGESHASELTATQDTHPGLPVTPPIPEAASTSPENQNGSPIPAQPVSAVVHDITASSSERVVEASSEDLYSTSPVQTESAAADTECVRATGKEVNDERPTAQESAEEEKKRLEREERERVLAGGAKPAGNMDGEELPPYEEIQE